MKERDVMIFLLSKLDMVKYKRKELVWEQLGIVIAENEYGAAAKIKMNITRTMRKAGKNAGVYASLKNNKDEIFMLESHKEITGPLTEEGDDTDSAGITLQEIWLKTNKVK